MQETESRREHKAHALAGSPALFLLSASNPDETVCPPFYFSCSCANLEGFLLPPTLSFFSGPYNLPYNSTVFKLFNFTHGRHFNNNASDNSMKKVDMNFSLK